jgi:hypothetical protein
LLSSSNKIEKRKNMTLGSLKKEATSFLDKYQNENPATFAAAEQAVGGLLILDGFIGIDNPLGTQKRSGFFGSLAGIFVGVILLFVPTLIGNLTGVSKMTATTDATVVSVGQPQTSTSTSSDGSKETSSTCSSTVKYTVDGKQYTQASSASSSGMCSYAVGQSVQIDYNPNNPGQWATDAKTITKFLKIFFWFGVLAIVSSIFTSIIRLLSIIFGWKLLKNGRALAKTLPQGTDMTSAIKQIEHEFKTSLFGFGAAPAAPQAAVPQAVVTQPTTPAPQSPQTPPMPPITPTQPPLAPPTTPPATPPATPPNGGPQQ